MAFTRKYLSADGLHALVFDYFNKVFSSNKIVRSQYSNTACVMSSLAIFRKNYTNILAWTEK